MSVFNGESCRNLRFDGFVRLSSEPGGHVLLVCDIVGFTFGDSILDEWIKYKEADHFLGFATPGGIQVAITNKGLVKLDKLFLPNQAQKISNVFRLTPKHK